MKEEVWPNRIDERDVIQLDVLKICLPFLYEVEWKEKRSAKTRIRMRLEYVIIKHQTWTNLRMERELLL